MTTYVSMYVCDIFLLYRKGTKPGTWALCFAEGTRDKFVTAEPAVWIVVVHDDCPSGTMKEAGHCVPCNVGTFWTSSACVVCPSGQYQDTPGQTSCKASHQCALGEEVARALTASTDRECRACEPSTYQDELGQAACKQKRNCVPGQVLWVCTS